MIGKIKNLFFKKEEELITEPFEIVENKPLSIQNQEIVLLTNSVNLKIENRDAEITFFLEKLEKVKEKINGLNIELSNRCPISFSWHFLNPHYNRNDADLLNSPYFKIDNESGFIRCKIWGRDLFTNIYLYKPFNIEIDEEYLFNELMNKIKLEVLNNKSIN